MILNSFAVLDGAIALVRLAAGLFVVWLAFAVWRGRRRRDPEERRELENQYYLLSLIAFVLLGLNLVSWPLLYLLLQSYIPEWPGAMCIYGVMQIGEGSLGPARFLPTLLATLQWLKPLVIFLTGCWFVLYLLNRETSTGVLTSRVLAALAACGIASIVDSGVEAAYLAIPKKEEVLATGCCAVADIDHRSEAAAAGWDPRILQSLFFALSVGMAAAMLPYGSRPSRMTWLCLAIVAVLTFAVGRAFLIEVGAPEVLHLPYHHCPYDLIGGAPETLLGIGLFAWATLSVGWACWATWLGPCPETRSTLPALVGRIAFMGFCCYLSAVVMAAVELVLA